MLDELGFGLDLERCAATGDDDDLVYVSPKTRAGGQPLGRRALPRPAAAAAGVPRSRRRPGAARRPTIADAFRLTGYFLARHVSSRAACPARGADRSSRCSARTEAVAAR